MYHIKKYKLPEGSLVRFEKMVDYPSLSDIYRRNGIEDGDIGLVLDNPNPWCIKLLINERAITLMVQGIITFDGWINEIEILKLGSDYADLPKWCM
jgi:hypothetical protein